MIIKADPGYSIIITMAPDVREWAAEKALRMPVIAWDIADTGTIRPLCVNHVTNASDVFVIEFPNLTVHMYNPVTGDTIMAPSLAEWIEIARGRILSNALKIMPTAGSA